MGLQSALVRRMMYVPEGNCGKAMDHGILATEQRQQRGGAERCVAVRCGCELVSSAIPECVPGELGTRGQKVRDSGSTCTCPPTPAAQRCAPTLFPLAAALYSTPFSVNQRSSAALRTDTVAEQHTCL